MMLNLVLPIVFVVGVVPIVIRLYGITRWQANTVRLRDRLLTSRARLATRGYETRELEALPPPVQRFFQSVLTPGQPLIAVAEFGQSGHFNLARTGERWATFSATQIVVTQRPGFDWDARIRRAPGIQVCVHDTYIAGVGYLKAALSGLLRVAEEEDRPALAGGQLMRFLAEAVWYPTKLLPSQGVRWSPIDANSALATLQDGETQVSLTFVFDEAGMVRAVRAEDRYRMASNASEAATEAPWEARFWGYEVRGGMRIPLQGEAAWQLPNGRLPYWRGQLTDVLYKFAS